LKRRRLAKPLAIATSSTGMVGVGEQALGEQQALGLRVLDGATPNSCWKTRRRWRSVTPSVRRDVGQAGVVSRPSSISPRPTARGAGWHPPPR
jgi:hypothetical protein